MERTPRNRPSQSRTSQSRTSQSRTLHGRHGLGLRFCLAMLLCLPLAPALAQADWGFDPGVLASGQDLLQRTPPREMDGLFQAVHAAAQVDGQARALCALFDPDADRGLEALDAFATQLGPASRQQFANALGTALVASLQSPPQPDDSALAKQALKSAAVTAAILHDGFGAGFSADAGTAQGRTARCRSLRWLLDAMRSQPLPERASMTRLLLQQGLAGGAVAPLR